MSDMSASDVALLNRDNGWGDNGFMWIFAMLMLAGGGGFGWGNNGYHPQYATQEFVQNGFNFNDLQDQNRDILSAITGGTAQAVAAAKEAEYETINVAKDAQNQLQQNMNMLQQIALQNQANQNQCCCNTLRAIDGVKFENAQNTAAINANTTAQTQLLETVSQRCRIRLTRSRCRMQWLVSFGIQCLQLIIPEVIRSADALAEACKNSK